MIEQYENEIKDLKKKMDIAEKFAETIPIFSQHILDNKLSGNEQHHHFGNYYKKVYFPWGINRYLYQSDTTRTITNYNDCTYSEHLFSIYINTLSMYNSHNKHGLEKIKDKVDLFFYDYVNSRLYVTDKNIEPLLNELCEWYKKAVKMQVKQDRDDEIIRLQQKLDSL